MRCSWKFFDWFCKILCSEKSDNKSSNDQTLVNIIGIGGAAIAGALGGALLTWWFAEPDRSPQHHQHPTHHFEEAPPLHDPTCAICLGNHNVIMLPCQHSFDIPCIRNWFTESKRNNGRMTCPTCRYVIPRNMENEYSQRVFIEQD